MFKLKDPSRSVKQQPMARQPDRSRNAQQYVLASSLLVGRPARQSLGACPLLPNSNSTASDQGVPQQLLSHDRPHPPSSAWKPSSAESIRYSSQSCSTGLSGPSARLPRDRLRIGTLPNSRMAPACRCIAEPKADSRVQQALQHFGGQSCHDVMD
ncbi:uncharacterized protein BKA78DRAFT_114729 [Phyllosticta capitalensis]|uniref:uncharacterized protein n=1 Tax=Phyllosticta capitalensis TaxID=121624 RepID=UPI00312E8E6A